MDLPSFIELFRIGKSEALIRNGIVRELNRGGHCYFVHNRVYNIQSIADRRERWWNQGLTLAAQVVSFAFDCPRQL